MNYLAFTCLLSLYSALGRKDDIYASFAFPNSVINFRRACPISGERQHIMDVYGLFFFLFWGLRVIGISANYYCVHIYHLWAGEDSLRILYVCLQLRTQGGQRKSYLPKVERFFLGLAVLMHESSGGTIYSYSCIVYNL
jgi:hypothetical protein